MTELTTLAHMLKTGVAGPEAHAAAGASARPPARSGEDATAGHRVDCETCPKGQPNLGKLTR
jgi:hypothetical protein